MGFADGRVLRVTLRAQAPDGEEQVNTFHYDLHDVSGVENDPQSLADTFRDDVRPLWATLYRSNWTIDPVVVTEEKDPLHPLDPRQQWTSGAAIAGTGTGTGDLLPPGLAVLVSLTTDHIGRRFRGRLWLSGSLEEGQQSAGSWASSYLTGIETILAAIPRQPDISPPLSSSTAKWSVYSRTQRAQSLDPYLSPITGHITRTLVHNMRRRSLVGR